MTKKKTDNITPLQQIDAYLEQHKGDHYNFEEERIYAVSSGSLLLDIEMGGGIKPGVVRATGVTEGGKPPVVSPSPRTFRRWKTAWSST